VREIVWGRALSPVQAERSSAAVCGPGNQGIRFNRAGASVRAISPSATVWVSATVSMTAAISVREAK